VEVVEMFVSLIYDSSNLYARFFTIVQNDISVFYFLQSFAEKYSKTLIPLYSPYSFIYFLKSQYSILTSLQQKFLIDLLAQFPGVIFFQPFPVIFGAFANAIRVLPDP